MRMFEAKRLHPIAAVENVLKQLKELLLPYLILFVFGNGVTVNWQFIMVIVPLVFIFLFGILNWFRFTYRIEDGELRIESGIFVKKKRYIPFERIQSLDLSEGILQRLFGLVKVKVETAGSSAGKDAEAVLTAITKAEAVAIQDYITAVKNGQTKQCEEAEHENQEALYQITISQLLLLATTSGGVGVIISAVAAFIFQFDEIIPYEKVFKEFQHFVKNGVVFFSIVVLLVILVAWVAAFIRTLIRYTHFTVRKVDDDLIISRGLLEKSQLTIPINRIQGIRICENIIRQPLGLGTVYVESAGDSVEKGGSSEILLIPIMKKAEIADLLSPFLTAYDFTPEVIAVPKRAFRRYLFRSVSIPLLIAATTSIVWNPWGYLAFLMIPLVFVWSYLQYKDAGWNVQNLQLTLTYRRLIKHTIFMQQSKIQALTLKKSYFQKKRKLATVSASIKAGASVSGGTVVDLEEQDSNKIYQWYSRSIE